MDNDHPKHMVGRRLSSRVFEEVARSSSVCGHRISDVWEDSSVFLLLCFACLCFSQCWRWHPGFAHVRQVFAH